MKSELTYERYAHGEPPASPSPEDERRMEELAAADAAFLAAHPARAFLAELEERRARRARARWLAAGSALAACLVLALAGFAALRSDDGTRMKGGELKLFAYHKTAGGTELLDPERALVAGDEIQIAYFASGRCYAAILSVDGRGAITRHMPLHGADALEVDTKAFALLPYSYKLDDAPRFEDLYLVASPRPFKVDELRPFIAAAIDNGAARMLLPAPFRYATMRVKKQEAAK